jgi:hypothetical protein
MPPQYAGVRLGLVEWGALSQTVGSSVYRIAGANVSCWLLVPGLADSISRRTIESTPPADPLYGGANLFGDRFYAYVRRKSPTLERSVERTVGIPRDAART